MSIRGQPIDDDLQVRVLGHVLTTPRRNNVRRNKTFDKDSDLD